MKHCDYKKIVPIRWPAVVLAAGVWLFSEVQAQVFVANFGNNSIEEFDSSGNATTFAAGGLLNGPSALAFDSRGNLFVANYNNNTIVEYTPAGAGTVFASAGLNNPTGLALDNSGNLFVANAADTNLVAQAGGSIQEFNSMALGTLYASGLSHPYSIAIDGSGHLYVAESTANAIMEYGASGQGTLFASSGLIGDPALNGPWGLTFAGGNLYVANYAANTIGEFNPNGQGALFASSGLNGPAGLAFDGSGHLFVANYSGNTIEEFNSTSGVGTLFSASGLNEPIAIAVAPGSVPEPPVWALLAAGVAAFQGFRRRR